MTDHTDLIAKLKAATPSRELDEAIAFAVQFRPTIDLVSHARSFAEHEAKHDYTTAWIAHAPWRREWGIPAYTSNIDAALTLVPLEPRNEVSGTYDWQLESTNGGMTISAQVGADPDNRAFADSPALALCIAALRARSTP
jgi:hypothetical protein